MPYTRIRRLSGTAAAWSTANPVLMPAEAGYEDQGDGTYKIKIGDGVKHWNDLPYAVDYQAIIAAQEAAAQSEQNAATSEANALTSKNSAADSAAAALASKNAAKTSEDNAAGSAASSLAYKNAAGVSAGNAATSEANALASKNAAGGSATNAANSAAAALVSQNAAGVSAGNAADSETNVSNMMLSAAFNARYSVLVGQFLSTNNGLVLSSSGYISKCTDMFAVNPGDVYLYQGKGTGAAASVCFYDGAKSFISGVQYTSLLNFTEITVPSGAVYARFASYNGTSDPNTVVFDLYRKNTGFVGSDKVQSDVVATFGAVESAPTLDSKNLINSGAVYQATLYTPILVNILNPSAIISGKYGTYAVGSSMLGTPPGTNAALCTSEVFSVKPGDVIRIRAIYTTSAYYVLAGADGLVTQNVLLTQVGLPYDGGMLTYNEVTIPDGVCYLRFVSRAYSYISSLPMSGVAMVTKNRAMPSAFVPYGKVEVTGLLEDDVPEVGSVNPVTSGGVAVVSKMLKRAISKTCFVIKHGAGLLDFTLINATGVLWLFPDHTTSTNLHPAKTVPAGITCVWCDNWMDGTVQLQSGNTGAIFKGDISDLPLLTFYLRLTNCSQLTGSLADLPPLTYNVTINGSPLITGDLTDLPPVTNTLDLYDCLLITGDLADLPPITSYLRLHGCILITGNLANLPPITNTLDLYCCSLVTGDLADLPPVTSYIRLYGCNLITGSLNNVQPLTNTLDLYGCRLVTGAYISVSGTNVPAVTSLTNTGLSASDMDNTLIAYAACTKNSGTFTANGMTRTAASDDAVANLTGRGWTISGITKV